ncbi:MAG TPA: porin [Bryobacteraceae bacterium]|jgi:phosphate-selective porin OprO/OprP|nr:porin [Bryobacteraceae bacterium]
MFRSVVCIVIASIAGVWSVPVCAQTSDQERIADLERKIEELDKRLRAAEAKTEPATPGQPTPLAEPQATVAAGDLKNTASVSADQSGFTIKSADGNYLLKIGADLQVDVRTFTGTGSTSLTDQILLRRVRPTFSGTVYKYVDYYFRPDFGQGTTVIYDAYLQLNYFPRFQVRAGKFKPPVGLERLQSDDDTSFIERGLPTLLVPSRDIGFQISGDLVKRRIGYQAGVFNGVPDNGLSDASPTGHRSYAGRIFATPFQSGGESPLSGLGFGIGVLGGSVDNVALPAYKTAGQNTFFTFNSGVVSAGHRTALAPQAYYYLGPFGLLTEYTVTEEGFQKGNVRHDVAFRAWQVEASYILTGEKKGFTSPTPRHPFEPLNHGWGAWELAVRVGNFHAEKGLFNYGFADPTKTPGQAHEWLGGVNWYLNRLVRISLDYGNTNFGGGALNADRAAERVILARFQINFI